MLWIDYLRHIPRFGILHIFGQKVICNMFQGVVRFSFEMQAANSANKGNNKVDASHGGSFL